MLYKEAQQKKKQLEKQTGREHIVYELMLNDSYKTLSTFCVTDKKNFERLSKIKKVGRTTYEYHVS